MIKIVRLVLLISIINTHFIKAQNILYSENIHAGIEQNESISKVFSLASKRNTANVALRINGFDIVRDNIIPAVEVSVNNQIVFSGALSEYTFGRNHRYGTMEFDITNFVNAGNNQFSIQYAGLSANSYVFVSNLSVVVKEKGLSYKNLKDFNYDTQAYVNYLRNTLTVGNSVSATENYQKVSSGMTGIFYGEASFNPNFCLVQWSQKLGSKLNLPPHYPKRYREHAFYVPFSHIKINESGTLADNIPPAIHSSVQNNARVRENRINISGRATDRSGVYALYINNIKANIDTEGFYNLNMLLNAGSNAVKIKALDNFGNIAEYNLTLYRDISSSGKAPELKIAQPASSPHRIFTNFIQIHGEVSSGNALDYLQVIANNQVFKSFAGDDKNFTIHLNLRQGENRIEITAFDEAGLRSRAKELKVVFEPETKKPQITLTNPMGLDPNNVLFIDKFQNSLPISVSVSSEVPIKDVAVTFINSPVNIPLSNTHTNNFSGTVRLPQSGITTIKITANNTYNISGEFTFVLQRRETEDPFPDISENIPFTGKNREDSYALIIGNANYDRQKSLFNSLPYVENDAKVFREYLINTYGVPSMNISYVSDAGTMEMMTLLQRFTDRIKNNPDNNFLLYYSGHGAVNRNQASYFVPVDYNENADTYGIGRNFITDTIVYRMLLVGPRKLTVVLDMCYSGREDAKGVDIGSSNYQHMGPVVVFSASEFDAYPFNRRNHSLFTYSFLKAIHDTKGNITYKQLAERVQNTINQIIDIENLPYRQTIKVAPSSVLDHMWESWELP